MKFSNKLSFTIFSTGSVALILLLFAIYKFNYDSLMVSESKYIESIANEVSDDIDLILSEKIKTTLTLANSTTIIQALEESITFYADLPDEKRKESINQSNEKWKLTKDPADNFILKFTDNKAAQFLKQQQALIKGEYGEIFLTNKFGALVASTSMLSTFAHGHKYWWLGSYNNGKGAVFFDDRGYDDSVNGYVLGIVVPIKKGNEIIGILKCNLNILGSISSLISGAEHKLIGKFLLSRSGGMVIFEEDLEPLSTRIQDDITKQLMQNDYGAIISNDSKEKYLVGFSQIKSTKGKKGYGFGGTFESIDHKKGNKGESWYILCYRQLSVIQAPIMKLIKSSALMGISIIVILLLVSYFFGRKVAQPLAILNRATKKVGKGDFNYLVEVSKDDEFGNLARSFNQMIDKLRQTTTSIGLLENEVDERKKVQKELQKSRAILQAAMDQSQAGIAIADAPDGKLKYVNKSGLGIRGKSQKELVDDIGIEQYVASWQILHFDGTPYKEDEVPLARAILYGEESSKEFIIRTSDNEDRFVWANAAPIFDDKGKVSAGIVVFLDITKRRHIEAELEKLSAAIQQSPVSIIITDLEGHIEYVNPKFCKLTGYSFEEVKGMNPSFLQSGQTSKETYEILWETILAGKEWRGELRNKKKNGTMYWEDAVISGIFNKKGEMTHFLAVKEDITNRKQMETQLLQAQKMESIGTLAGGIAHDFNNILFPIVGHTEMLLEDISQDSPLRDSLDEIYTSSLRAKDLVNQILTFSRQEKGELKLMKMQPIIKEALKLIRSTIPTTISIIQNIQTDCGVIKADPTQIHQILMNLTTNAFHAMEDRGGKLTVTLKEIELGEYDLINPDMVPGLYACLSIEDQGIGMNKDLEGKIFEPFFTTKGKGKGTGMGLSVVHGIVAGLNGGIQISSKQGEGTKFLTYFPIEKKSNEHKEQSNSSIPGGTEHVLLVDDEESIIKMEEKMLERLGYQVTPCTSSIDAVEAFRVNPETFDLVITDFAMPEMAGDKLALELLNIRQNIPIILNTGFSEKMSPEVLKKIGIKDILMKPMVRSELAQTIRKVLDK